jgi:serine O-acetyltransferase
MPAVFQSSTDIGNNEHTALVSSEIADWTREEPVQFWDPGRKLLLALRRYQYWRKKGGLVGSLVCRFLALRHRFWSIVTGADIPLNCQLGGGLLIPHPNGIVIHPDAIIGVNCLIFQQVTIGTRDRRGSPEIGGHVDIGAGAKILGPVRIGDHARIGANAVVLKDIAPGAVSIGYQLEVERPQD